MKSLRMLPILCVLFLTGCLKSKIHQERSFDLESGTSYSLEIDPPTGNQKIKVVVTSADSAVDAYILLEEALTGDKQELDAAKLPEAAILDKSKNTKEATLSATIPSKKAYRIFIYSPNKKTKVTVKVDSV